MDMKKQGGEELYLPLRLGVYYLIYCCLVDRYIVELEVKTRTTTIRSLHHDI